ncbi:MAG TPA: CinA family nicotinamide mononucleotide deamidase-related protein [Chloroflexia bacterium]|nr:CinA family nicotinamide mononucleotide deamidase-related protein [Chloroflexia bacterium]
MRAEIVSIGTERLLGTITDTNAAFLAQRLAGLGIDCFYVSQVGDNQDRIVEVLGRAWDRSDLTITTGGIGPTQDDLTREAIASLLAETPHTDLATEALLRAFFQRRGYAMPERNLKQAMLIPSASLLNNPVGTAPGWWVERKNEVTGSTRIIVSMPGVPFEMKRMWLEEVEPRLRPLTSSVIVSRTLKVAGIGESSVEEMVADLMIGANPTLAPYAKRDGIHLRITAKAASEDAARGKIAVLEEQVRARLGDAIFGADEETPHGVVAALLRESGTRFALLEVGEGAVGAVSSLLGSEHACLAAITAPDLRGVARIMNIEETTLEETARALQAQTGADMVLAVSVTSRPISDTDAGSVYADAEIVLRSANGSEQGEVVSAKHSWRTAQSEVGRVFGLAALNMLRRYLLAQKAKV